MKLLTITLLLLFLSLSSWSQKEVLISLEPTSINIHNRSFYIDQVIDNRSNKQNLGYITQGAFSTLRSINFSKPFEEELLNFYTASLPKLEGKKAVTVKIKELLITEKIADFYKYEIATVAIDYFLNSKLIYSDKRSVEVSKFPELNIAIALKNSLLKFNDEIFQTMIPESLLKETSTIKKQSTTKKETNKKGDRSRDALAFGYQIGGYSLVGFDYEFRIDDLIGLNFGAGLLGYTAGIKMHMGPSKLSPFFNFNLKDGGLGDIKTIGADIGGSIPLSRESDLGLRVEIGLGRIVQLSEVMRQSLFGNTYDYPDYMVTFGVGFSF